RDESEKRISASLDKYSKQIRRVSTGQQALFAYMDALAKVILSTLPDTDEDIRQAAAARGKIRYARVLKSAGANIVVVGNFVRGEPIVPSGSCEVADGCGWIRHSPLLSVDRV